MANKADMYGFFLKKKKKKKKKEVHVGAVFVQQPQVGEDVHKLEGLPHLELAHAAAVMESTKPQLHSHTPAELTWFSKRTAMRCSPGACHQSVATTFLSFFFFFWRKKPYMSALFAIAAISADS